MTLRRPRGASGRARVMVIARGFPNRETAGNMTYVDAIVAFLERGGFDPRVVVLGDRFPNNEFFYRYADPPGRLRRLSFRQGVRVGPGLLLTGARPLAKNAARRTVLALPARVTSAVKAWYFTARQVSTEDWFAPLDPADVAHAVAQVRRFRPDHLLIDSFMLSEIVEACGDVTGCMRHLIMHDLVSARLTSLASVTESVPSYHAAALAEQTSQIDVVEREELRRLALFDSILAIQRAEAEHVATRLPDKRVFYVPMPADTRARPRASTPLSRRCLFVGSSGHANMQGIHWFLESVWPRVRDDVPDAVLDICGTCCHYLSPPDASVRLHGRVGDLESLYGAVDVCIVPLLAGSGMKIKLVEAMSFGSACVATAAGMQGLEDGAGSAFLAADTADTFAASVARLMRDAPARDRLQQAAVSYVDRHLSTDVVFRDWQGVLCA